MRNLIGRTNTMDSPTLRLCVTAIEGGKEMVTKTPEFERGIDYALDMMKIWLKDDFKAAGLDNYVTQLPPKI